MASKNLYYKLDGYIQNDFHKSYIILDQFTKTGLHNIKIERSILESKISYKNLFWCHLVNLFIVYAPFELAVYLLHNYTDCIRDSYRSTPLHLLCLRTFISRREQSWIVRNYLKRFLPMFRVERDSFGRTPHFYVDSKPMADILRGDPELVDYENHTAAQFYLLRVKSYFVWSPASLFSIYLKQCSNALLRTAIYTKKCVHSVGYIMNHGVDLTEESKREGNTFLACMSYNYMHFYSLSGLCQCENPDDGDRWHAMRHINNYAVQHYDDQLRMEFLLRRLDNHEEQNIPTFLFAEVLDIFIHTPDNVYKAKRDKHDIDMDYFPNRISDNFDLYLMSRVPYLMQTLSSEQRIEYTERLFQVYERLTFPSKFRFLYQWISNLPEREMFGNLIDHAVKNYRGCDRLYTFLHIACEQEDLPNVRFYLRFGAHPNEQNHSHETPMHLLKKTDSKIYRLLLDHGAHGDILDRYGNRANGKFARFELRPLRCLSARAVTVLPSIQLPNNIVKVIENHQAYCLVKEHRK